MQLRKAAVPRRLAIVAMLVLGMAVLAGGLALAQEAPGGAPAGEAIVTVTAHGRVTLAPTRATVETAVEGVGETPAAAEEIVRARYAELRKALTELGFEIVPGMFSLNPHWDYTPELGNYQNGFEARRYLEVVVPDPARLGEALAALTSAGVGYVYNIRYRVDDLAAAQDEALRLALEQARRQADSVARHTGLAVGRIVSVNVGEGFPGPYPDAASGEEGFEVGLVTVQVYVTVSYELVQP